MCLCFGALGLVVGFVGIYMCCFIGALRFIDAFIGVYWPCCSAGALLGLSWRSSQQHEHSYLYFLLIKSLLVNGYLYYLFLSTRFLPICHLPTHLSIYPSSVGPPTRRLVRSSARPFTHISVRTPASVTLWSDCRFCGGLAVFMFWDS